MDPQPLNTSELIEEVSRLIQERKFGAAEDLLTAERMKAASLGDVSAESVILSELIELYCISDPTKFDEAEKLSLERERIVGGAISKLQTGMILSFSRRDYARAAIKLREAADTAKTAEDAETTYTSLGLLGHALLQLGREKEARAVLGEMEGIISAKKSFVVGDETLFLEEAKARGLEVPTVKKIATELVPLCRDPEFRNRLRAVAKDS